jgi:hypothetical protein
LRRLGKQNLRAGYITLLSLSIVGVVDIFGWNVKLSAERFYERFYSFYLEVGRPSGFAIGYDADADSLRTSVPSSARYD